MLLFIPRQSQFFKGSVVLGAFMKLLDLDFLCFGFLLLYFMMGADTGGVSGSVSFFTGEMMLLKLVYK